MGARPVPTLLPPSYVEHIESAHVDWVGVSVSLHVDDSMDSTVERKYSSDVDLPTFTDEALRQIFREYRQRGIDVYLTLAFETHEAEVAERPLARFLLGDPGDTETGRPPGHAEIDPEFWPWRPSHPDHERFVAEFWRTYTRQAIRFARLAQEEGVRMFSLGTETDGLFRTRPGGHYWPNDFLQELRTMVAGVRAVYDGLLTYDMHHSAHTHDFFAPGSRHLWSDLGLDVIGVSAWFPLVDEPPTTVLSVEHLQREYDRIFREHLIPTAVRNELPVVLLEYGIVDMVGRPSEPGRVGLGGAPFSDMNGNGLDDGQEQQANVIEAMFRTMSAYPGVGLRRVPLGQLDSERRGLGAAPGGRVRRARLLLPRQARRAGRPHGVRPLRVAAVAAGPDLVRGRRRTRCAGRPAETPPRTPPSLPLPTWPPLESRARVSRSLPGPRASRPSQWRGTARPTRCSSR